MGDVDQRPVKDPRIDEDLRTTAHMLLDLLRKRVGNRRVRVLLFARATRVALDALPPESRGPGFVPRTWELPELGTSAQELNGLSNKIDRFLTSTSARALLLSRATQLAIDDLSPDEQICALAEASQIIGTPPLQA